MPFTFKVGESIKKAWILYKENFGQMLGLTLIMLAIQFASQSLSKNGGNFFITVILIIISVLVSYIWIRSIINLLDGKGFNPFSKESLPTLVQIWDFVKTNILIALCVIPFFIIPVMVFVLNIALSGLAGAPIIDLRTLLIIVPVIIVFTIPAIYIASRLFGAKYLSVDKCQGAVKTIKESWNITRGNGWKIFWKTFLIGLFIMLGFLALVVGMIVTLPVGMIVMVMMYREIVKNNSVISTPAESPVAPVTPEVVSGI